MPIANTVEATIIVNFEDRFSGPACKAFENFRKCAEAALKALDPALTALFIRIESGIDKFVNAIDRFALAVDSLVNNLVQKNKEVLTFGKSLDSVGQFFRDFLKDMQSLSPVVAVGAIVAITLGIVNLAKLAANFPLFTAVFVASVYLIIEAWDTLKAIEKIELEVKLKDEATARAGLLRQQLEGTFRDPIVQEIQVLQRNIDGPAGFAHIDGALTELTRGSRFDLGPQFDLDPRLTLELDPDPFPSFASGIRFVPRDMLAQIHKGETVLPRSQAEKFRDGRMGGISVDNITINMNGGSGANRNEAKRFARMIREELKRTDERTTP